MHRIRKPVPVVAAVLVNDHKEFLVTQRRSGDHFGGYWEFPGGRIEPGENAESALIRELQEELDIKAEVKRFLWQNIYEYDIKTIDIAFYLCTTRSQEISKLEVADFRWIKIVDVDNFLFPPADHEALFQFQKMGII